MKQLPLFIVFEGIDGSGTTTQGNRLQARFEERGHGILRTSEPSQGAIGSLLRSALRGQTDHRLSPRQVALLFAADRLDHCEHELSPALAEGRVIICDRYLGSTLTFQVIDGDGELSPEWLRSINQPILEPDLTFLIDVPVEVSMERIIRRGKPLERFEVEQTLRRVRERYLTVMSSERAGLGEVHVIDGTPDAEVVQAAVWSRVEAYLERRAESAG